MAVWREAWIGCSAPEAAAWRRMRGEGPAASRGYPEQGLGPATSAQGWQRQRPRPAAEAKGVAGGRGVEGVAL